MILNSEKLELKIQKKENLSHFSIVILWVSEMNRETNFFFFDNCESDIIQFQNKVIKRFDKCH